MAKTKSSAQEELSASKTGIDMTFGLGFTPAVKEKNEEVKKPEVIVEETKKATVAETKAAPAKTTKSKANSAAPKTKAKLQKPEDPEKDETIHKISALISTQAKENLEKFAKMYGYKKISPFINDLFEHLDAYMDDED